MSRRFVLLQIAMGRAGLLDDEGNPSNLKGKFENRLSQLYRNIRSAGGVSEDILIEHIKCTQALAGLNADLRIIPIVVMAIHRQSPNKLTCKLNQHIRKKLTANAFSYYSSAVDVLLKSLKIMDDDPEFVDKVISNDKDQS